MKDNIKEKLLRGFDEKYYDKNSPSGLNQKSFKTFTALVLDIRQVFLSKALENLLQKEREEIIEWAEENKSNYFLSVEDLIKYLKDK